MAQTYKVGMRLRHRNHPIIDIVEIIKVTDKHCSLVIVSSKGKSDTYRKGRYIARFISELKEDYIPIGKHYKIDYISYKYKNTLIRKG